MLSKLCPSILLFSLFATWTCVALAGEDIPIVKIEPGKLKGKILSSRDGRNYEAFLGIPYATVPARFEDSIPAKPWDGTQDATNYGPVCAQASFVPGGEPQGDEDCLHLNVYTPKADNKRRPVLVFIHGGGFTWGSGHIYGANYILDEELVLVTINYRVGILGFLNTRDGLVTGNMGLKDQMMALKWIQENIEAFGGDPARVTISGESAGAASVMYQVLSPLTKGLFQQAILQSGSSLNPWAFRTNTLPDAVMVGEKLECKTDSSADLVDCLKNKPLEEILKTQASFTKWYLDPMFVFAPSLEIKSERNPNPFLPKTPAEILKSGKFARVPILMTMNKDEGLLFHSAAVLRNEKLLNELNEDWDRIAPITFYYGEDARLFPHQKEVSDKIREFYFGGDKITMEKQTNLTNLYTDAWFLAGIHKAALQLAKHTSVYMGLFTRQSKDFSCTKKFGVEEVLGVTHADELSYLYSSSPVYHDLHFTFDLKSEDDIRFSKEVIKVMARFVESGIPKINFEKSLKWKAVTKKETESGDLNWMNLSEKPFLYKKPFKKRMAFWKSLYNLDKKLHKDEL